MPTKKEMYYYKLAYDRIPNVNLRSAKTVAAMERGAVWEKIANMEDIVGIKRDVIKAKTKNASYTWKKGWCSAFSFLKVFVSNIIFQ